MTVDSEAAARGFVAARCEQDSLHRLDQLAARLAAANQTQNLVSNATLQSVWRRHIADSAQLLDHVPRETPLWLDLGSGAGFPGLVIAVMKARCQMVLVESRRLRIEWLNDTIDALGCANCRVIGQDVRKVATFNADVISARAFAPLDRLIALSARFSTSATRWVLPKGRSAAQEVSELPARARAMFHVKQSATDPDAGIVVGTGMPEIAA